MAVERPGQRVRDLMKKLAAEGKTLQLDQDDISSLDVDDWRSVVQDTDIFTYSDMMRSGEIDLEQALRGDLEERRPIMAIIWIMLRSQHYPDIEFEEVEAGLGIGRIGTVLELTGITPRTVNGNALQPAAVRGARRTRPVKTT